MTNTQGDTIWSLVRARAAASPDAEMAVDEHGRRLTFSQYAVQCEAEAEALRALGVKQDTVVAWQLPTWIESMVLFGALCRVGAVQNPLLPLYREREVAFIIRQSGASFLLTPSSWRGTDFEQLARGATAGTSVEHVVIDRALPVGSAELVDPDDHADAVRFLYYTSGTTAEPKGARHTNATIISAARCLAEGYELTATDRQALVFPFAHIGGAILLTAGMLSGCGHILTEAFDPTTTIDLLAREGVTLAGSGAVFHQAYLERQRQQPLMPIFSNVRGFPGGAAPKPAGLHAAMRDELGGGILSSYGLTEAPILTVCSPGDPDDALARTEGRPGRAVQLRVVDGELRVKAPQVCHGYVDSALNKEAFDDDGWFRTGDLGRIDDRGFVEITGRLKDIIIRKGENISAKEVEDFLHEHPAIRDVAVIGLPDPVAGERCCAVVVLADRAQPLTLPDVADFLRSRQLAVQKTPEQLEIVPELPRNSTGKVLKHELRSRFAPQGS